MDVTLPPLGAVMLQALNMPWINIDAGKVDETASAISASTPALASASQAAEAQTRNVTEHSSGDGVDAMSSLLPILGGAAGLGAVAAVAHRFMPAVLHGFANVVRGSQVASVSQLVNGAARFTAAGLTGGPLAQQGVLATTKLAYARIRQAMARGVAHVLTPALRKNSTGVFSDVSAKLRNLKLGANGRLAADGPVGAMRVDIKWKGTRVEGNTEWTVVGGRRSRKATMATSDPTKLAEKIVARGKRKSGNIERGSQTETWEYDGQKVTIDRNGGFHLH